MARFYVTTPIYYVNDAPHIGHAYTTLTADALARWHRLLGDDVFFLTGTDEHGLKVKRSAEANGLDPQEQADIYSARFRDAWELLDISNDDFIRTTEPRHHRAVSELMQAVYDNGWITPGTYEGLYCVACEAYYTEADLVDGLCPVHHRPVEFLKEENYFFRLSAFSDRLLEWYADNPGAVTPEARRNEALGLIKGGLQDISVTRTSLDWGVRVPWDSEHVFYVWYDALINYATAVGYGSDIGRFEQWWPAVHHLIGKDILRFHCVYWPALCMAAGIEPPPRIAVHGFLLVGGEKMSKTAFNQISPAGLVPDFGVDGFRYHFLRDQQFGPDGDFSYEAMVARYNADLANNLGNLLARVGRGGRAEMRRNRAGPAPDSPLAALAGRGLRGRRPGLGPDRPQRRPRGHLAARPGRQRRSGGGRTLAGGARPAVDAVLGDALEVLRIVAVLASPALARAPSEIWRRIGLAGSPAGAKLPDAAKWGGYPGGLVVDRGAPAVPSPQRLAARCGATAIATSLMKGSAPRPSTRPRRLASPGSSMSGPMPSSQRRRCEWRLRGRRCLGHGRVAPPRSQPGRGQRGTAGPGQAKLVAIGECGLDYHYDLLPVRLNEKRVRSTGRPGQYATGSPWWCTPGTRGKTRSRSCGQRACLSVRCFTASPAARAEVDGSSSSGPGCLSAGS